MSIRNTVRERFTTFITWKNNESLRWREDRRLCKVFDRCLKQNLSFDEDDLIELWVEDWKSKFCSSEEDKSINKMRGNYTFTHPLTAYLQESLLIAAKNRFKKYGGLKEHTEKDYFNLGFILLCKGKVITKNLFFFKGKITRKKKKGMSTYPFKSYMITLFISRINDELRTQDKYMGRTSESLLLEKDSSTNKKPKNNDLDKTSHTEKRLREALQWRGITGTLLEEYITIWSIYREVRQQNKKISQGKTLPLSKEAEEWSLVYQEIKHSHPDFTCSIETIQERMRECNQAVSDYLSPKSISLNNFVGDSDDSLEYLDNLVYEKNIIDTDKSSDTSIYSIVSSDLVRWTVEDISLLTDELSKNDGVVLIPGQRRRSLIPKFKLALDLYYGLKMEQTVVADYLNSYYPEVAKQIAPRSKKVRQDSLTRLFKNIKLILAHRSVEHFKNSEFLSESGTKVTFQDFEANYLESYINQHGELFELVFKTYYESTDWRLYAWLERKIKALNEVEKKFLELYYVQEIQIFNEGDETAYSRFGLEFMDISSYLGVNFKEIINLQNSINDKISNNFENFANSKLDIKWSEDKNKKLAIEEIEKEEHEEHEENKKSLIKKEIWKDLTLRLFDRWLTVYCKKYPIFFEHNDE